MRKQKGFTLVELVVVVMILGILAAVAAPKLLNTSGMAADNGLKQTLGVVRDAIERYAAEHNGAFPGEGETEVDFKNELANYLRGGFPVCPVGLKDASVSVSATGSALSGDASPTTSWKYDAVSGEFICNSNAATKDGTTTYSEL